MKKFSIKALSVFFALLVIISSFMAIAVAAEEAPATGDTTVTEGAPKDDSAPEVIITSDSLTVVQGRTIQLKASVKNIDYSPSFLWASSDTTVATVNANGTVKGIKPGKAQISATVYIEGKPVTGYFVVNVTTSSHAIKDYLENQQVLGYQYSYIDDYYYTNDKDCWQDDFGFGQIYDIAAPYVLLEYDYVRVFFTYDNKDWMVQLWKGQYGLLFYGSEIGIYNRPHTGEEYDLTTFYNCPGEEDWLNMEMTLYHDDGRGNYVREFTREYDKYWWCTGFKGGHLRDEEPADELRMTGTITFKDEEMTRLFVEGLMECKFAQAANKDNLALDSFAVDGNNVYLKWQNISDAENTMPIKVGVGFWATLNLLPVILPALPVIVPFFTMFGMAMLFLSIII